MATAKGGITPGQKRFVKSLKVGYPDVFHFAQVEVIRGPSDDATAQEASAVIGKMQAKRTPLPALRLKPPKQPRIRGERTNKKRRASK